MGKLILVTVTAASLTGAVMMASMQGSTNAAERQVNKYRSKEHARGGAKAAYVRAKRHVWSKWSSGTITFNDTLEGSYGPATYEARIVSTDTMKRARAEIEVTGRFDGTRMDSDHEIDAVFISPTLGGLPKAFDYAIMSEGNLELNGNIDVDSDSANVNSNLHTNQTLDVNGSPNSVEGFGTFSGSKSFTPSGAESSIFSPNENPDGENAVQSADEVDVPEFDADDYEDDADRSTEDETWSGTEVVNFTTMGVGVGTEDNPAIWYVDGDLEISGSVEVSGYGIMVVTGSIDVLGGASTSQTSTPPGWLALYAEGDVAINGNTEIHGQIFSDSNVTSTSGTPKIHGNIVSRGETRVNGTPDLDYKQADPVLTEPIWGGTEVTGLKVDAYTEW